MKRVHFLMGMAGLLALGGCGGSDGGSGGLGVIPAPPPQNSSMSDLQYSQAFTNDAATLAGSWDPSTGTARSGTAQIEQLSIRYDAASQSYTLQAPGRSATFTPADIAPTEDYQVIYQKAQEGGNRLTLVLRDFQYPEYVALGFWQHSVRPGQDQQDTEVSYSAFGLPSPASAIPLSGAASHFLFIFGTATAAGEQPLSFGGYGSFNVDFGSGTFSTDSRLSEYGLVSGHFGFGDGIGLQTNGTLGSNGSFSGRARYGGQYGESTGTISGRFYGPNAEEVGAAFATSGDNGLVAAGAFVGRQTYGAVLFPDDRSLPSMRHENSFAATGRRGAATITWHSSERVTFDPPLSPMGGGMFTSANKIASADPNFTTYQRTYNSYFDNDVQEQVTLQLYKFGTASNDLQLTYTSFGHWQVNPPTPDNYYFNYGFATDRDSIAIRRGSAHYEGTVYGTGSTRDASAIYWPKYDVRGTSAFHVNFSDMSFDGLLALTGTEQSSGERTDFGHFDIEGSLDVARESLLRGKMTRAGVLTGEFLGGLFGPNAEELSGTFQVDLPSAAGPPELRINGAAIAVQQ